MIVAVAVLAAATGVGLLWRARQGRLRAVARDNDVKMIVLQIGANDDPQFADTDYPMFRLADAYLMYAEAVLRGRSDGTARATISTRSSCSRNCDSVAPLMSVWVTNDTSAGARPSARALF